MIHDAMSMFHELDMTYAEVIRRLLEHFDECAGTTFLYDEATRKSFILNTDPIVRGYVAAVLNEYHTTRSQP